MGEADERGTFEERREEAVIESADVIICLEAKDGVRCATIIPEQDDDNPAIILAGYINANLPEMLKAAMEGRERAKTAVPQIVTSVTPRIAGVDGPDANTGFVGADGLRLQ